VSERRRRTGGLKAIALGAACLAPATGWAQDVSDLNPPAPSVPAGTGGGFWMPGMPMPTGSQNAPSNPMNGSGGIRSDANREPPGAGHGQAVLDPEDVSPGNVSVAEPRGERAPGPDAIPETHLVRKGDTLWDISATYFKDPWYWPKLWAYNPSITNPHWIYPGDVVRLAPANAGAPLPVEEVAQAAPEPTPAGLKVVQRSYPTTVTLRQNAFVESGDLAAAGTVIGSREEKLLLTNLDEVYVESGDKQPLRPGERYSVYRVVDDVKRPGTRQSIGSVVEILGEVEVRGLAPDPKGKSKGRIVKAAIVESLNPVERGDRVGPLRREYKMVDPRADEKNVDGIVVTTLRGQEIVGEQNLVFIDKGRADGLEAGNRMVIVQRGDGYKPLLTDDPPNDPKFPREVIGELIIVEAKQHLATGIVTRSTKEVWVGAHVEARKGY